MDTITLADEVVRYSVTNQSRTSGFIFDTTVDEVQLPTGSVLRQYAAMHADAVAVLPVRRGDEGVEFGLVRQYRHPVGRNLWGLPAGKVDTGESYAQAAARECGEEIDLWPGTLTVLSKHFSSPGGMDEEVTIFVGEDLDDVPESQRYVRTEEEASYEVRWFHADDVLDAILNNRLRDTILRMAVLAWYCS